VSIRSASQEEPMLVAVTAVGTDRPGIVSRFTGTFYRLGCNLGETTMTRLRDQFAMLLLAELPDGVTLEDLQSQLGSTAAELGLSLVVRALPGPHPSGSEGEGYILRLYGADKPGIVHAVTSALGNRGLNITDLNTRVIPGADGPVYVMLLEVDLPDAATAEALKPELERLRGDLGVEIGFEALEREAL
jgi:glycine cleavage system transcriptional repressor